MALSSDRPCPALATFPPRNHPASSLAILGLAWIFPAMVIIRWMETGRLRG